MLFEEFCRALGLIVETVEHGRWVRVPTTDHPRKRNGAYRYLGTIGWAQNHALSPDVSEWRPSGPMPEVDRARIVQQAQEYEAKMRAGWVRAAKRAEQMVRDAKHDEHPYLHIKGFKEARGLVIDDTLIVPMRHWRANELAGAQLIRWLPDERRYEKKMLPGMRAKGAVFRIGSAQAARTWLVEGFATGLSVEAAVRLLNLRDSVLVCFSAGNLTHVAPMLAGKVFVFADNDESGAGERAAVATGFPYCMAGRVGEDANDLHQREGIFHVASLMMDATQMESADMP